ncbi:MAG: polysaccharide deacetylase family protein, partial [Nanoarchaeota archaeon]|nr:polysaccharide deacetylase family protein [Nanoarchaeota archaeon]
MIHITIDCEELNLDELHGKSSSFNSDTYHSRKGNERLLQLLDRYNVKCTFFVTGRFAQREKDQVRKIVREGHEIAGHGFCHFYRGHGVLDLEQDISECRQVLSSCIKQKILGFRAPQMQYSKHLIQLLDKHGFLYDSSLHPAFLPGYYINSNMSRSPFRPIADSKVIEFPVAVDRLRFPVSWVFTRFFGVSRAIHTIRYYLNKGYSPVLYFHSWEFHDLSRLDIRRIYRQNTGTCMLGRLEKLIRCFRGERFMQVKETLHLKQL